MKSTEARATLLALTRTGKLRATPAHVLAGLMRAAGTPVIAGADPALADKLTEANDTIASLEQDASAKWTAFEAAKKAFVESGADPTDTSSDAFKTLDAAGKDHDGIADRIADAKAAREALARMVATEKGRASAPGAPVPASPELRQHAAQMLEAGKRITDGAEWKAAVESGVFDSSGDLGRVHMGKAWTRDELKAIIGSGSGSAGALIAPDRQGFYGMPTRPLTIAELVTVGSTDSNLVQFVRQTLRTHAAAIQAAEGDAKAQSLYAYELVDAAVKTIAHWVAAAKQALGDAGQLSTLIDGELRDGLAQFLEDQMVAGSGAGANLRGILNTTGILSPILPGMDGVSKLDRLHKGITAIRLAKHEPTAIGFHPEDWEEIRLMREATAGEGTQTGAYLMGSPITSGVGVTIWGLVPAVSTAFPKGTALVGKYDTAVLWLREGAQILASDSHADFFVENLVALLAEMRAAFGVPRPEAFADVDMGVVPAA